MKTFSLPGLTTIFVVLSASAGKVEAQPIVREYECIPGVIRNDGQDSFRLEVKVEAGVTGIIFSSPSAGITPPTTGEFSLVDDGTGLDQVAEDGILTAGPFVYNTAVAMESNYMNDPSSPAGLSVIKVGTLRIVSPEGNASFLVQPHIGILRSDLPETSSISLAVNLVATPHFLNLETTSDETQRSLRSAGGDISNLTQAVYSLVPDDFDFFVLFSTRKLEVIPAKTPENFLSGAHLPVQVNFTGTGQVLFDHTSRYGSDGRLLGIAILDRLDRGLYSANLTHELLHQWGGHLAPTLKLLDADGHYNPHSSIGSILGGQDWKLVNGKRVVDCSEGRNGAYRASPLDRYLMGLITKAEVPNILIYPNSQPMPLFRCGAIVTGTVTTVTATQIEKIHGVRTPDPSTAKRDFSIAFMAESKNRLLNGTELTFYETLAEHFTKVWPEGEADPYIGFNWAPITRFFGSGVTWSSAINVVQPGPGPYLAIPTCHDLETLISCAEGPAIMITDPACQSADFDYDGDVDQNDFGLLQQSFSPLDEYEQKIVR